MGAICESGQILVGAVVLLILCTLLLFSVYDIALFWRDRAKLQQAVDSAALSSGAIMSDVLVLMHVYNYLAPGAKLAFPAQVLTVGKGLDVLRTILEKTEFIGSLTGMIGVDTFYPMFITSPPNLGAYFDEATSLFIFTETQNPGRRVFTITGTATTLNDRYLFKRYTNYEINPNGILLVNAKVGIFKQGGFGITYVPVLLK